MFSVLMSIYHRESPDYFNQAMKSVWDDQSLKPNEIVLVEDGKLTDELDECICFWEVKLKGVLRKISLEANQGLGKALSLGLNACKYDYVARMDTDDICMSDRFQKQMSFLIENPDVDLLGGQILEFDDELNDTALARTLPTHHDEIVLFAKSRCPFNHPSVVYRKDAVIEAGGYQNDPLYEDYALWVRMISSGAKVANLPDVILHMRAGDAMFHRRGGIEYAKSEFKSQCAFYKSGFISLGQLFRNLIFRMPVRVVPNKVRTLIYRLFLRG